MVNIGWHTIPNLPNVVCCSVWQGGFAGQYAHVQFYQSSPGATPVDWRFTVDYIIVTVTQSVRVRWGFRGTALSVLQTKFATVDSTSSFGFAIAEGRSQVSSTEIAFDTNREFGEVYVPAGVPVRLEGPFRGSVMLRPAETGVGIGAMAIAVIGGLLDLFA